MSKVIILANDHGTIYNFRRELIARLIEENYEVVVVLPYDNRNPVLKELGCRLIEIKLQRAGMNPLEDIKLYYTYKKLLKEEYPDIVLTYTIKPNIYGNMACSALKIKCISNVTGLGSMFEGDGIIKRLLIVLQKRAYRKTYCVFFQNESNLGFFLNRRMLAGKSDLLPGSGVNLVKHVFADYPDESDNIRFITVSRIRKDKGFTELFEAIDSLLLARDDVEFHVVGGYEDKSYKEIIEGLLGYSGFHYHGEKTQEEVGNIVRSCHCMIHPTYHEGMSNVMLEAAAAGRPILASDIPGCREIVDEGRTGFLFGIKDAGSIVSAINTFLALNYDKRFAMGRMARDKVEKEFDRNIVIDKYIREIAEVIG